MPLLVVSFIESFEDFEPTPEKHLEAEVAIRFSVGSHSVGSQQEHPGTINLNALPFPEGTHVLVRYAGLPHHCRLSLKGPELNLRAAVNGLVQIARSLCCALTNF